jgi:hypothetical protein
VSGSLFRASASPEAKSSAPTSLICGKRRRKPASTNPVPQPTSKRVCARGKYFLTVQAMRSFRERNQKLDCSIEASNSNASSTNAASPEARSGAKRTSPSDGGAQPQAGQVQVGEANRCAQARQTFKGAVLVGLGYGPADAGSPITIAVVEEMRQPAKILDHGVSLHLGIEVDGSPVQLDLLVLANPR